MIDMKFTFKTKKPKGRWRSFDPDEHYIKLKKQIVGSIDDARPHKIRLKVVKKDINEDKNPNCTWKWITLTLDFDRIADAKKFLNDNIEKITEKWTLFGRDI